MNRQEYERTFRELLRAHNERAGNDRCIECTDCERCSDCTFCSRSHHLVRCHYCVATTGSIDSIHCHESRDLVSCTHCNQCERCAQSAYLERSVDCADCSYCFGCVGLSGKEFHILNEPYDRSTYFKLTAQLAKQL
ncbi:MAG: hypothetical protein JRI68_06815 [Deltaproteobacteria bacterium]|nr:hypothetical protein [Deltaproteobacteria bacterium]